MELCPYIYVSKENDVGAVDLFLTKLPCVYVSHGEK